jgi:outer membrane protein TolC
MKHSTHGRGLAPVVSLLIAGWAAPAAGQDAPAPPRFGLGEVVASALSRSAGVALGVADLRSQEGALRQSAGAFDPQTWASVESERKNTPAFSNASSDPASVQTTEVSYGTGVDWRLRSGIVVSPSVSFSRVEASSQAGLVRNTGVAGLDVVVPMLRGRGGGMQTATERAAHATLSATAADLRHQRAAAVVDAVTAYWGYVAAVRNLAVFRDAEARTRRLVEQTQKLIEADERPAADRLPMEANLASRRATRLAGEQSVALARQVLAEAMGLPPAELAALPLPTDSFPAAAGVAQWPAAPDAAAVAVEHRPDVAAARERRAAAEQLLRGARRDARTQLDLTVGAGYTGLESGVELDRFFSPFYSGRRGLQGRVSLSYALPAGNRFAGGQLMRSAAADQRAAINLEETSRRAALEVLTADETLKRSVEEVELSRETVRLHRASVESELRKYQLGSSTLFDVIQAEEGLTSAILAQINVQRRYAVALLQMRFLTGTLLAEGEDSVDPARLTTWGAAAVPTR